VLTALGDLAALAALADPARRRLYELVAEASRPLGREEAAEAAGIGRSLAAYHLDRLAEHGLLDVGYRRLGSQSGPGAGRPAKVYTRARREFVSRTPPRDYLLLGELLVRAVLADGTGATRAALEDAARELGRELARNAPLVEVLRARGYEPAEVAPGRLRLRNCPFDAVAARSREIVCGLNLALVQGLVADRGAEAVLAPTEGACCVSIALA
jgi:predicted ArsR family transcriptional regulator